MLARSAVFITDGKYKAKWVYLARYFIGHDLGRLHDQWGFLKSHTKPHAWSAPSYYLTVASAVKDISDVFVTFVGKSLAVKVIYSELLIISRVRIHSKILWQDKLGRTIPWSKVYLHLYRGFSTNQEQDVFFKVVHYVLKTGEYFSTWNRLHICMHCSFCPGQLETLKHLFLDCVFAKEVGCWVSPLFCKLLGSLNFVPAFQTLLGLDFVESFPMATQRLAMYFLKLILYVIWHFRKMKHFERVDCMPQNAISLVVEFNFRQTCSKKFEFWRGQLKKHWLIWEAFCKVNHFDRLVFFSQDLPVCSHLN